MFIVFKSMFILFKSMFTVFESMFTVLNQRLRVTGHLILRRLYATGFRPLNL